MNFYGSLIIEHEKNERKYSLILPIGVSYEDAHAAVLELASGVLEMQKQAEAAQKQASTDNTSPESVNAEVVSPELID